MVFGWGKKKEVPKPVLPPKEKEILLSDVSKIVDDLLELRTKQTVSEIKHLRDITEPLIQELVKIGHTLEKDNLKIDDIDRHLGIIVVRGKKQVIEVIKKDAVSLPTVSSYNDVIKMNKTLNHILIKIGDVLGRQTRVIHIFAKKYAEKLKNNLAQMNSNHNEIKSLVKNYDNTQTLSLEISEHLKEIETLKDKLLSKEKRIADLHSLIDSLENKIISLEERIEKAKSSSEYKKFLELTQTLDSFTSKKQQIKNEIDIQFTKISRPLGRYEYGSSMEKEQKLVLSQLVSNPYTALVPKNKDSIIIILENVRKGILSGSISVKDVNKSMSYLTETEELLDVLIGKIKDFDDKKQNIQDQIDQLSQDELKEFQKDLKKTVSEKDDSKAKIIQFEAEIKEFQAKIPKLIFQIESKLKQFSNTRYIINQSSEN